MSKWFWVFLFINFKISQTKEIQFNEIYVRDLTIFVWKKETKKGSFIFKNKEIVFLNAKYSIENKHKINNDLVINTTNDSCNKATFYLTKTTLFVYFLCGKKQQLKILY